MTFPRVVGGVLAAPHEQGVARRARNLQQAGTNVTRIALAALAFAFAIPAFAEAPKEFAELQTKGATFKNVRVVSKNPSSITVRHSGGIAQILFKDLSPELQEAFGYVPEDMEAFEAQLRTQAQAVVDREARERTRRVVTQVVKDGAERMDRIVQSFGIGPELKGVDMRPRLRELELIVKDQGNRPSCAVYAVVSALELQAYEVNGRPEKYSEQYLIWATMQAVGERAPVALDSDGAGVIRDAGFSLDEVFHALNRFGIPTHEAMKSVFGEDTGAVEMPREMIAEARKRSAVIPYAVPGSNESEMAVNMVHVLNNGLPVVIAIRWPHQDAARGGLLSTQPPIQDYAHAVTVVGYSSETGKTGDIRFIFKNSWGPKWGAYGYGFVDMQYLSKNLLGAAFIDLIPVRRPQPN
ncbi:MAG TPA: C1 family peptidase [Opitutaceae bacterium]|nr:C1 family peptidase [Opitutaceae bacterium]